MHIFEDLKEKIGKFDKENSNTELKSIEEKMAKGVQLTPEESENLSRLYKIGSIYSQAEGILKKYEEANELLQDSSLSELATNEVNALIPQAEEIIKTINVLTAKTLEHDNQEAIIEIRPGVGGVEASIFAEDLFRMYTTYLKNSKISFEVAEVDNNDQGGIREAIIFVNKAGAYGKLRFESGVHRVQRVPKTEAMGRIHTSTASVAVLPKFPPQEVKINPNEIRIDVYRSSGPGGQSVNTTDSAVRITHLPTKLTVSCQNSKSQHLNKEMALSVLYSRLSNLQQSATQNTENAIRKEAIGDSDRSSKIRTYNFPQSRVTDHRVGKSWFNIGEIVMGDIEGILTETSVELRK